MVKLKTGDRKAKITREVAKEAVLKTTENKMKLTKSELMNLSFKDIESKLNSIVHKVTVESDDMSAVKLAMVEEVKTIFSKEVKIREPYYSSKEVIVCVGPINIMFNVGAQKTGKTVKVSRLKKADVYKAGKFKLKECIISISDPDFEALDLNNYTVKLSGSSSNGPTIHLKHRKEIIKDIVLKESIKKEIEEQNESWKDITKKVTLLAAQPKLKEESFGPGFNEKRWEEILDKTYDANKSLIEDVSLKIITLDI